jgi:phospholipase/lecithinase/hemolysin
MESVAAGVGAEFVTVPYLTEGAAPGNTRFFLDPAHPNVDGHALVADSLLAVVGRILASGGDSGLASMRRGR